MNNDIRKQIYDRLNQKETDELVEIWKKNDQVEWTEDAFNIIREILLERLGEIPSQGDPIFEHIEEAEPKDDTEDELALSDDDMPEFYNPHDVLKLEKWLFRAAIAAIIASVISNIIELPNLHNVIWSYNSGNVVWNIISWIIAIVAFVFLVGLQCIVIYFPLKALGSILEILMAIEFSSRGVRLNHSEHASIANTDI